jgi:hypothetical protein
VFWSDGESVNNKLRPISDYYWVGASDVGQQPGQFFWTDGTKVDDAWWQSGQPNEHGQGKETYVVLGHAKLWDLPYSESRYFVCEVGKEFAKCLWSYLHFSKSHVFLVFFCLIKYFKNNLKVNNFLFKPTAFIV